MIELAQCASAVAPIDEPAHDLQMSGLVRRVERDELLPPLAEAQQLVHMGSWEWLIAENRVSWSDELFRLYGLAPRSADVTYEAFLAFVHPDDVEAVRTAIAHSFATGEPFEFDHRVVLPDGAVRVMHAAGRVEMGEDGAPRRMSVAG